MPIQFSSEIKLLVLYLKHMLKPPSDVSRTVRSQGILGISSAPLSDSTALDSSELATLSPPKVAPSQTIQPSKPRKTKATNPNTSTRGGASRNLRHPAHVLFSSSNLLGMLAFSPVVPYLEVWWPNKKDKKSLKRVMGMSHHLDDDNSIDQ